MVMNANMAVLKITHKIAIDMSSSSEIESDCESDCFSSGDENELSDNDDECDYDPEGVESDEDSAGCCKWKTSSQTELETIKPSPNLSEFGKPSVEFDADVQPNDLVEKILDDEFIDKCIDCTNAHGSNDPVYIKEIGVIEKSDKGRSLIRGFFALKWHLSLIRYPQKKWAWSSDPLKSQTEVKKVMTFIKFKSLLKHFRVTDASNLPERSSPSYHPLQNIQEGVDMIKRKSQTLWSPGFKMCIDEGRIRSKSKRNKFKIRNPDKPIRMGWTVNKIADQGELGGYYTYNHLVKVGKQTYTNTGSGKNYNTVEQLLEGLKYMGRLVVMDSGFPTIQLLKDAASLWNTRIIATVRGNTAHLPKKHSSFLKNTKSFVRGYSQSLHHENLNLTYWNDNNAVCFLDNDVDSAKENWSTIKVNGQAIHTPPSVVLYRQIYGMVDRTNQHQAYYNSECRSVRKQSRVLDSLIETYALCNTFTIWKNLHSITEKQRLYSSSEFRFAVIRNWYAKCRMHNNKDKLLRNPSSNVSKRRKVEVSVLSPRKGKVIQK